MRRFETKAPSNLNWGRKSLTDSDKNRVILAECIARAWEDDSYRRSLVESPGPTLAQAGFEVPAGVTLTVRENTSEVTYVVLPRGDKLENKAELADALEKGLPLGEHELRLVQNSDTLGFIVIPAKPAEFQDGELDMAEVATLAGGVGVSYHDVAANVEGVANAVGAADVAGATTVVAVAAVVLT